MYGRHTFLHFLTTSLCVLYGTQVEAYFYDVIDPLKADFAEWHQRDPRVALQNGDLNGRTLDCVRPETYYCEVPPNTIPAEATKTCNYRSVLFHEQVYKWVAGRGCLFFTPDFLYASGYNTINLNTACDYEGLAAPCLEIAKEDGTCGCFPFDPALEEVVKAVREAIIPAAHGRWESCFYTATECCTHHMTEDVTAQNHCDTTFDGWSCWEQTEADTVATQVCSEFAYSNTGPTCHHYSTKQCFANGTWELQTDYSTCSVTSRLLRRYRFHIAVLSFSIVSCIPAVFVFFFYKRLRVTRVALHRNLLIAIIMRNVFVIVSRSTIYIDELTNAGDTIMSSHGVGCRILAILERITANVVFVAMLVEGIYLHRTIVTVFRKKLNTSLLYGIGAVIAIIPVVVWSIVMGVMNDHSCWLVYTVPHIQWSLDGPRVAILLINTGLFIDILRVLLTKLRNSENSNQLSTTKATLFLMPLFGTQFLLTALRPSTTDCAGEQLYYFVSYSMEGLQGFLVALLYCYINKEVHGLIKSTYRKTENAVVSRIRRDSVYPRPSTIYSDRRLTCSTALPSPEDQEQYAFKPTKLHVAEIISIQASERLAEILEPVYETIQNGVVNEGYDSLERSENSIPPHLKDDYYAFTNASSVSIDCQDWIICVSSPSSSVYNNSLNDYETRYLERKFPNHPKLQEINEARGKAQDLNNFTEESNLDRTEYLPTKSTVSDDIIEEEDMKEDNNDVDMPEPEYGLPAEGNSEMLDEIMQYIGQNEPKPVLDSDKLCPNRNDGDKVIFVEE